LEIAFQPLAVLRLALGGYLQRRQAETSCQHAADVLRRRKSIVLIKLGALWSPPRHRNYEKISFTFSLVCIARQRM